MGGGGAAVFDGGGEGEGDGDFLLVLDAFFCLSASSAISVSVRRSRIVLMWWVVERFARAVGEAVNGRAER